MEGYVPAQDITNLEWKQRASKFHNPDIRRTSYATPWFASMFTPISSILSGTHLDGTHNGHYKNLTLQVSSRVVVCRCVPGAPLMRFFGPSPLTVVRLHYLRLLSPSFKPPQRGPSHKGMLNLGQKYQLTMINPPNLLVRGNSIRNISIGGALAINPAHMLHCRILDVLMYMYVSSSGTLVSQPVGADPMLSFVTSLLSRLVFLPHVSCGSAIYLHPPRL
ncbi:hypothetical protein C8Q74DRAFT_574920 [Fomes fomentarius]|nr:hypothetical protein C8Q74DRAFT_574920 [Fomes fomentarius]